MKHLAIIALAPVVFGCGNSSDSGGITMGPTGGPTATVRIVYRASTTPRMDLPAGTSLCVAGVGPTHIHPGWRQWLAIPFQAAAADRWEIAFNDVPATGRQAIRVSDGNACDQNPTGAATRNVFANDVLLTEIVTTPGSGPEPGLSFAVDSSGRVTP